MNRAAGSRLLGLATSRRLSRARSLLVRLWASPLVGALAKHRLVQFVVLGGLIFAIAPSSTPREVISLRRQSLRALLAADNTRAQRPSGDRLREIEARALEDEILYREGLRLGLERDDGIVRQRVIQKVLFFAEELGGASRPPSDAELRAFFAEHSARFTKPPRVHFRHAFARERAALPPQSGEKPLGGQASPIGPELEADLPHVERTLGVRFAQAVAALPLGTWSAPIESAFGWHTVRVLSRAEGGPAEFREVLSRVIEQFSVHRRQSAIARYVERAFSRYLVDIDGTPVTSLRPPSRLANRNVPSGED